MTLEQKGVYICHIPKTGFIDCVVIHSQPKKEMIIISFRKK